MATAPQPRPARPARTAVGTLDADRWARVDGAWQEVVQTQELWPCRPLRSYGFPDQVVGTRCFDYDAGRAHGYHHA